MYTVGKKIIVIGCPGSGKSFLSRQLRDTLSYPLFYLDQIFWKENWEHLSKEEMIKAQEDIFLKDEWIIDGNYQSTMDIRFKNADTIIFLDMKEEECLKRVELRTGQKREDFPSFLEEKYDPEFIQFIKDFKNDGRKIILNLMGKYKDKNYIVLKSLEEKDSFIESIK